jgi:hypothetical protein
MVIWPARVVEEAAALLGVSAWAPFDDVKRAFHAKALKHHPDKVGPWVGEECRGGMDGCLWPGGRPLRSTRYPTRPRPHTHSYRRADVDTIQCADADSTARFQQINEAYEVLINRSEAERQRWKDQAEEQERQRKR